MKTEAFVDLLRKTLTVNGHVRAMHHPDSDCRILNQGEYLVSLLAHDESLQHFLLEHLKNSSFRSYMRVKGSEEEGYLFAGLLEDEFGNYVDIVRFVWLLHGATAALHFIKEGGFVSWSSKPYSDRDRYLDSLVFIAQKRLRSSGLKYSDFAEFFADPKAVRQLRAGRISDDAADLH